MSHKWLLFPLPPIERESQSGKVCLPRVLSEIHLISASQYKADSWVACGDPLAERYMSAYTSLTCCEKGAYHSLLGCAVSQWFADPSTSCSHYGEVLAAAVLQLCTLSLGYGGGFPNRSSSGTEVSKFWGYAQGQILVWLSTSAWQSPPQLRQWDGSSRRVGFGKLLIAVHTQSLCSPQTHATWREVPWNQKPQGGWDLLPSVPGKLKLFSFHKGRKDPVIW